MTKQKLSRKAQEPEILKVNNKFGEIEIHLEHKILFPHGIIGMPEYKQFCIANIPDERFSYFKLLQSITEESLVFLAFPIDINNKIIDRVDLVEAANFLNIDLANLAILLIASTKMIENKKKIVVNARAPIFIDTANMLATQYVITNTKYDIQFILE